MSKVVTDRMARHVGYIGFSDAWGTSSITAPRHPGRRQY